MIRDFNYRFDPYRHWQGLLFSGLLPALKKMSLRADMNLKSENVLTLSARLNVQARFSYEPKCGAKHHQNVL